MNVSAWKHFGAPQQPFGGDVSIILPMRSSAGLDRRPEPSGRGGDFFYCSCQIRRRREFKPVRRATAWLASRQRRHGRVPPSATSICLPVWQPGESGARRARASAPHERAAASACLEIRLGNSRPHNPCRTRGKKYSPDFIEAGCMGGRRACAWGRPVH